MNSKALLFVLFSTCLAFSGCKKSFEDTTWDTEIVTPIVSSSLSIRDIVQEDSSITFNVDNSVNIVFKEHIYSMTNPLDSLVDIQIAPFLKTVGLQTLSLSSQNLDQTITIEEMIQNSEFKPGDGSSLPAFALAFVNPIDIDPINIDVSEFFESAVLTNGILTISLENELPVTVESVDFTITNIVGGQTIYMGSFNNVMSGETEVIEEDLAALLGDTPIEGQLQISTSNFILKAESDPIPINYTDYIRFGMQIDSIKVKSATAIFPAQNVVDTEDTTNLQNMGDIQLTRLITKKASVNVKASSTIPDSIFFHYEIPSATKDGQVFAFDAIVPPATDGAITFDEDFVFNGYDMDLTGFDGTLTNSFVNKLVGRIDSTNEKVFLTLEDSIRIELTITEIIPSYAEGYFGQDTIVVPLDSLDLDIFDFAKEGSLTFETLDLTIKADNGLGIDAKLDIEQLSTANQSTSANATVSSASLETIISPAINNGSSSTITTTAYAIPNAENLLNIQPDLAIYALSLQLNPGGNDNNFGDFIYNDQGLDASLEISLPLHLNAENLVLRDTISLSTNAVNIPSNVGITQLRLLTENGFPIQADVKLYILDDANEIIDSLVSDEIIMAADLNESEVVVESKKSTLYYTVSNTRLQNILNNQNILVVATLNTQPLNKAVKIYSDYALNFSLVGDFNFETNGQ